MEPGLTRRVNAKMYGINLHTVLSVESAVDPGGHYYTSDMATAGSPPLVHIPQLWLLEVCGVCVRVMDGVEQ